jgi:hypothetical protein
MQLDLRPSSGRPEHVQLPSGAGKCPVNCLHLAAVCTRDVIMALALSSASYAMVQNVASTRKADWNPMGVDVPYAVPEYVKSAPSYLDGSLVGDYGFDPLGLAAYSWPVFLEKGTNIFGERQPFLILNVPDLSNERRVQVMDSLSAEEQKKAVLWMREAELKHGRLARNRHSN